MLLHSLATRSGKSFPIGQFTVIVGRNNAGKSESLRDIFRLMTHREPYSPVTNTPADPETVIWGDAQCRADLELDQMLRGLRTIEISLQAILLQGISAELNQPCEISLEPEKCRHVLQRSGLTIRQFHRSGVQALLPLRISYLDCRRGKKLVASCSPSNPSIPPSTLLQALQDSDASVHSEFDSAFHSILGDRHIRLDSSSRTKLFLRIAEFFPSEPSGSDAARKWQRLPTLEDQGEGMRGLAAVILTVLLSQGRIVLLDEPALGLSPIAARRLGHWLATYAPRIGCQIILTTDSSELISGLALRSSDVTVMRMIRRGDTSRVHSVDARGISELIRSPLLAGQKIADVLLVGGAVISESDAESSLLEAIAQKELAADRVVFAHAGGRTTLDQVVKLLKATKIPTCVVANLDLLANEVGFSELVQTMTGHAPPRTWLATRERLAAALELDADDEFPAAPSRGQEEFLKQLQDGVAHLTPNTPKVAPERDLQVVWGPLRLYGLDAVPLELQPKLDGLLHELRQHGLFLFPRGHLSHWLGARTAIDPDGLWYPAAAKAVQQSVPADLRAFVDGIVQYVAEMITRVEQPESRRKSDT